MLKPEKQSNVDPREYQAHQWFLSIIHAGVVFVCMGILVSILAYLSIDWLIKNNNLLKQNIGTISILFFIVGSWITHKVSYGFNKVTKQMIQAGLFLILIAGLVNQFLV